MSFGAIMSKEIADLIREKRFGGWALVFLTFWSVVTFLVVGNANGPGRGGMSVLDLTMPFYFINAIALVVLALFVCSDGLSKERESGMLPLVGATPAVRWHVPLAKLLAGLVAYLGAYLVALMPTSVFAYVMGFPAIVLATKLFFGPFLALFIFLLGVGLLLGTAFQSSKVAIGVGAGVYFPLFLVGGESPFQMLYVAYPMLGRIASFTPFDAAFKATLVSANGGVMPVAALATTVAAGIVCAAAAFYLFHRQEVAA